VTVHAGPDTVAFVRQRGDHGSRATKLCMAIAARSTDGSKLATGRRKVGGLREAFGSGVHRLDPFAPRGVSTIGSQSGETARFAPGDFQVGACNGVSDGRATRIVPAHQRPERRRR